MERHLRDIISFSILLNRRRSSELETSCFENVPHDILVAKAIEYINSNSDHFPTKNISRTQALNDHGVDILVITDAVKLGIQIKSHFDVSEADFSAKVKRQYAESLAHGLSKWFLLICAPLRDQANDYSGKISHLVNELSMFKSEYHSVSTPEEMVFLMKDISRWDDAQFRRLFRFYSYEVPNRKLLAALANEALREDQSLYSRIEKPSGKTCKNCRRLNAVLNWGQSAKELRPVIRDLDALYEKLKVLPKRSREFFAIVLERSEKERLDYMTVPARDIESYLSLSPQVIIGEIGVLERQFSISIDEEDGIARIIIRDSVTDWPILDTIKEFSSKSKIEMNRIVVELNFDLFDE